MIRFLTVLMFCRILTNFDSMIFVILNLINARNDSEDEYVKG